MNQALRHRLYPKNFRKRLEIMAFEKENPYVLLYMSINYRDQYKVKLPSGISSYLQKGISNDHYDFSKNSLVIELMKFKNFKNKKLIEKYLENNFMLTSDEEFLKLKKSNGF